MVTQAARPEHNRCYNIQETPPNTLPICLHLMDVANRGSNASWSPFVFRRPLPLTATAEYIQATLLNSLRLSTVNELRYAACALSRTRGNASAKVLGRGVWCPHIAPSRMWNYDVVLCVLCALVHAQQASCGQHDVYSSTGSGT